MTVRIVETLEVIDIHYSYGIRELKSEQSFLECTTSRHTGKLIVIGHDVRSFHYGCQQYQCSCAEIDSCWFPGCPVVKGERRARQGPKVSAFNRLLVINETESQDCKCHEKRQECYLGQSR